MRSLALPSVVFFAALAAASAQENLSVLDPASKPGVAFENWLARETDACITRRSEAFEKAIKSAAACKAWQEERRAFFLRQIGGLPQRTPLNPRVTGTLEGEGYRVEKIILETRPGFHLTGNLYLPATPPPWPAVLVPCGHSHDGKAVGQYQLISRLLARHGMAALCYDPIGQGERYQILDLAKEHASFEDAPHVATPHPRVKLMCTTEHTLTAISSALIGSNAAQFRIWDGMRVIDYLQSRKDILAEKIGCTGNSGGGTETAYLMTLDDRIVAAAPGCFLTTFRALLATKGPQDGEQNIFAQLAFGMDEADYCIMRAPRPTLICAGTRDATFDFRGTMDLFTEAKRFYSRLGYADQLDIAAPDAPHGFTLQLREAVTRFISRWLLGKDILVREVAELPDAFDDNQLRDLAKPDWTAAQLQCTPQGQVRLMEGEKSVFDLNAEVAAELKKARKGPLEPKIIREAIGAAESLPQPKVESRGKIERAACSIEKLALTVENAFQLPALLFTPKNQPATAATLWLHGTSMTADAAPGGPIEQLVATGHLVLAAELRGIGETQTGAGRRGYGAGRFGQDGLEIYTAYLIGKSHVGMRTDDARLWTAYLASKAPKLHLHAEGEATLPALHAAALDRGRFATLTLRHSPPDWETLVRTEESWDQLVNVVHGVLKHYDVPDLIELIGKERVKVVEPAAADAREVRTGK